MPRPIVIHQKPRPPRPKQQPKPVPEPIPVPDPFSCVIRCPNCRGPAEWFRPWTYVCGPVDPESLKRSRAVLDAKLGLVWHFPQLFPPRRGGPVGCVIDLYRSGHWDPGTPGVRRCTKCRTLNRATLNWPDNAYLQVTFKRARIWAVNWAEWAALRSYIESKDRRGVQRSHQAPAFVRKLPKTIIAAKNREALLKAMDSVLM